MKFEKDLNDERVVEKFEIEKCYWEQQGVDWEIVTKKELPITFISNLKFLRGAYFIDDSETAALLIEEWGSFKGSILANL